MSRPPILTDEQILEMVAMYLERKHSQRFIAAQFGVSASLLNAILAGQRWQKVTGGKDVRVSHWADSSSSKVLEHLRQDIETNPQTLSRKYSLHISTIRNLKRRAREEARNV